MWVQNQEELDGYFKIFDERLMDCILSFLYWKKLKENINLFKQSVGVNYFRLLRTMSVSLWHFFVVNLCKFFDKNKKSISILNFIEKYVKWENEIINAKKLYEEFCCNNKKQLKILKDIRDKYWAHHDFDFEKIDLFINYDDTKEFLINLEVVLCKIMNFVWYNWFMNKFNNMNKNIEKESETIIQFFESKIKK